jgi:nicotinamide phosphoribosyltransferase
MTHPDWKEYEKYRSDYLSKTVKQADHTVTTNQTDKELIMQNINTNLNTIAQLLRASDADVAYIPKLPLKIALLLKMDSYKFGHPFAYRSGIEAMTCYGTARVEATQSIVYAGKKQLLDSTFQDPVTMEDVEQAQAFAIAHFGRPLFSYTDWKYVVEEHGGFPPLVIRSLDEGTVVPGGIALYNVTSFDPQVNWMAAGFETVVLRGNWYPTTIATDDFDIKKDIVEYYKLSNADMGMLPFALHDFGGRGVTCSEQAQIGGAAHLINFMGSDTVEGILAANHYYDIDMAAFSVFATEHSVECSFGLDEQGEVDYVLHEIKTAQRLQLPVASIVIDGKDAIRCAKVFCRPDVVELVKSGTTKIVLRPDSGDMHTLVPQILELLGQAYGWTMTSCGKYKLLNNVGVIQGDGVDHGAIRMLLGKIVTLGWAASNVIFGSGGALLQKVNRDKYKFAQKASAIFVNGSWLGIAKDPVTDPGKKSLEGVITAIRNTVSGAYANHDLLQPIPEGWVDVFKLRWDTGRFYNATNMTEIRGRVDAALAAA